MHETIEYLFKQKKVRWQLPDGDTEVEASRTRQAASSSRQREAHRVRVSDSFCVPAGVEIPNADALVVGTAIEVFPSVANQHGPHPVVVPLLRSQTRTCH